MKRCGRCGELKPLDAFHRRGKGGRQTWCRDCRKAYDAAYSRATLARRRAQRKVRHEAFLVWYHALKAARPCADCGGSFHPAAMHWDHLPGTDKHADLGDLVRTHDQARILAEIAKCELVCANCHAVRTFVRRRGVAQPG